MEGDPKPSLESISFIYTLYMEETLKLISCGKTNLFEADGQHWNMILRNFDTRYERRTLNLLIFRA